MDLNEITAERDLCDWLPWEDARLVDCSLGMQFLSAIDLASELSRDPLLILHRILSSDLPEMIGFDVEPGSEEEAEFLALGLAGAPLELILRWCTAHCDGERIEWDELAMYLTADLRPATAIAREAGIWFTGAHQLEALVDLAAYPAAAVALAVQKVLDRVDVPTPPVVLQQLQATRVVEAPMDWLRFLAASAARQGHGTPRRYGKRRRAASTSSTTRTYRPRRKRWAKARVRRVRRSRSC